MGAIRCEACGGTGKGPVRFGRADTGGAPRGVCTRCGGRGVLRASRPMDKGFLRAHQRTAPGGAAASPDADNGDDTPRDAAAPANALSPQETLRRKRLAMFYSGAAGFLLTFIVFKSFDIASMERFRNTGDINEYISGQKAYFGAWASTFTLSGLAFRLALNRVVVTSSPRGFRVFRGAFLALVAIVVLVWLIAGRTG